MTSDHQMVSQMYWGPDPWYMVWDQRYTTSGWVSLRGAYIPRYVVPLDTPIPTQYRVGTGCLGQVDILRIPPHGDPQVYREMYHFRCTSLLARGPHSVHLWMDPFWGPPEGTLYGVMGPHRVVGTSHHPGRSQNMHRMRVYLAPNNYQNQHVQPTYLGYALVHISLDVCTGGYVARTTHVVVHTGNVH